MTNIFKENVNLFAPYSNEYLFDFIYLLDYSDNDLKSVQQGKKIKFEVIDVIKKLLDLKIILIYSWCNNPELNNKNLTIEETIFHIETIWFNGATFPDFYGMVMFGTQKWYADKLWEIGMTHTTNWESFVNEKIGDLEEWIEKNKPKV